VIAPYGDIAGLMVNPFKNTNFTDAEAKITLGMSIERMERWLINSIH
jgi:inward rectifier potassium channel